MIRARYAITCLLRLRPVGGLCEFKTNKHRASLCFLHAFAFWLGDPGSGLGPNQQHYGSPFRRRQSSCRKKVVHSSGAAHLFLCGDHLEGIIYRARVVSPGAPFQTRLKRRICCSSSYGRGRNGFGLGLRSVTLSGVSGMTKGSGRRSSI